MPKLFETTTINAMKTKNNKKEVIKMETSHLIRRDFLKTATLLTPALLVAASCSSDKTSLEEIGKALVLREVEDFYNAKNITVADQIYSPNLVTHSPNAPDGNLGRLKKEASEIFQAFTDSHLVIDDLFAEGDRVAKRWTFRGTHSGEWIGIPATGKKIVVTGNNIFRIADEKIAEFWEYMDLLGMLQQLGVIPPLG